MIFDSCVTEIMCDVESMKATNWKEAEAAVIAFANGRRILWGVGNYDPPGCVVAVSKDTWSGDGMGYYARVAGSSESFEVTIKP
jgi:hypothetical protein